jgi:hypothetical protein
MNKTIEELIKTTRKEISEEAYDLLNFHMNEREVEKIIRGAIETAYRKGYEKGKIAVLTDDSLP